MSRKEKLKKYVVRVRSTIDEYVVIKSTSLEEVKIGLLDGYQADSVDNVGDPEYFVSIDGGKEKKISL